MASAGAGITVDSDVSRVLALLARIEGMEDQAMQRAAFVAYEALHSLGQAFVMERIEPMAGCITVVVHPSLALRCIVDRLVGECGSGG